jgi:hypothetical protein
MYEHPHRQPRVAQQRDARRGADADAVLDHDELVAPARLRGGRGSGGERVRGGLAA